MSGENTIRLKGLYGRQATKEAAAAYTPGHLLEETSAGTFQKHSTLGGYTDRCAAIEDADQGNEITDAYAAGDETQVFFFQPGDEAQIFLQAGQNITWGDLLISAGDGTLIVAAGVESGVYHEQVVARALETLDLTASGAVDTLLDVRFF